MTDSLKNLPIQVQGVASINRRGNIIDDGWYAHITFAESRHAHLLAIMILGDICYWYTPTVTTDERSNVKDYKKKFAADKLQKSYKSLGEKFGVSKRMAQTACYRLKELNLITIEVRDIDDRQGLTFLEPVSENIKKISCMCIEYTPPTFKSDTPPTIKSNPSSLLKVIPPCGRSEHTYTTSETTVHKLEEEEEEEEEEEVEVEKNGEKNEKDDGVGPDHQEENDQGENEDYIVEIQKPENIQNTESVLLMSQFSYLVEREGATHDDLAAALIKMDKEPDVKNPIAFLTIAIRHEKLNRTLGDRPKTEKPERQKTYFPATKPPKTSPGKYDPFYL